MSASSSSLPSASPSVSSSLPSVSVSSVSWATPRSIFNIFETKSLFQDLTFYPKFNFFGTNSSKADADADVESELRRIEEKGPEILYPRFELDGSRAQTRSRSRKPGIKPLVVIRYKASKIGDE